MKNFKTFVIAILLASLAGCEEVVDVGLSTAEPRLVVEASINWQQGTAGNVQTIKLSKTTGYFENEVPKVSGAVVSIANSSGAIFDFIETDPGIYVCNDFQPELDQTYNLTISYDGQVYSSTEKMLASPSVTRVEQNDQGGISGEDTEVKFFFDDLPNQTNFYFLEVRDPNKVIPEYGVLEDRFFQNNEMFGLYMSDELKPSDELIFTIYGVSQDYFNYMDILLEQSGAMSFGPFSTPTSTVRGNIVNQTDFNNYALGYFRLSQTDVIEYTIE